MKKIYSAFLSWVPLAIAITLLCGLTYVYVQQNYRMSANDPQIQIAQDISNQIVSGQDPKAFVPSYKIELTKSLATYIMLFDKDGKMTASSVVINGNLPKLPQGVFKDTKNSKDKETRFSWQPQEGVRSALVMDYYNSKSSSGFVAVGRSLYEVEKRIDNLTTMAFVGWVGTLLTSFFATLLLKKTK